MPLQRAAVGLLDAGGSEAETAALQRVFAEKRELLVAGARRLGMTLDREPDGTFYVWANLSSLPPALSDGMAFFRAALEEKVITVPGEFFDVNPGKRRAGRPSRFRRHSRLSFGPSRATLETALERLERVITRAGSS